MRCNLSEPILFIITTEEILTRNLLFTVYATFNFLYRSQNNSERTLRIYCSYVMHFPIMNPFDPIGLSLLEAAIIKNKLKNRIDSIKIP